MVAVSAYERPEKVSGQGVLCRDLSRAHLARDLQKQRRDAGPAKTRVRALTASPLTPVIGSPNV
jgi:hypothetical protein